MSIFKNMKSDGLEQSEDRLGGLQVYDSDIYVAEIKNLYATPAASGALGVTLIATLPNGSEYRETIYVSSKEGKNYFVKDGKKQPLPGFTVINDLCLIATGKELSELETEEKVVKVYDQTERRELPKNVPVITEALGQKVGLGILRTIEDKTKKNEATGEYEPTGETREQNHIDKVFHPELKVTVAEARKGIQKGEFWDAWLKRNQGQTRNRSKGVSAAGTAGAPPKAGAPAPTQKKSLFGK